MSSVVPSTDGPLWVVAPCKIAICSTRRSFAQSWSWISLFGFWFIFLLRRSIFLLNQAAPCKAATILLKLAFLGVATSDATLSVVGLQYIHYNIALFGRIGYMSWSQWLVFQVTHLSIFYHMAIEQLHSCHSHDSPRSRTNRSSYTVRYTQGTGMPMLQHSLWSLLHSRSRCFQQFVATPYNLFGCHLHLSLSPLSPTEIHDGSLIIFDRHLLPALGLGAYLESKNATM